MAYRAWLYDVSTGNEKAGTIDLTAMVSGLLPATNINADGVSLDNSGPSLAVKNLGITAAKLSVGAGNDWQKLIYDSSINALAWITNTSSVQPCRVVATTNINVSSPGTAIDGITLNTNDRILLTGQSTASQNGCYVFNGSASALTRTADTNAGTRLASGTMIQVWAGTANANTIWMLSTDNAITIGTTNLAFTKLNSLTSGTVTAVSIVTANGISGTVSNPTTTPAITLALANITPTSVTMGGTAQTVNGLTPILQELGTTQSASSALYAQYSNDANSAVNQFLKSRGTSVGTLTALSAGDILGKLDFLGINSSNAITDAAYYQAVVDGSPGATNIPSRFEWYTGTSGAAPLLRMTLNSTSLNITGNTITSGYELIGGTTTPDSVIAGNGVQVQRTSGGATLSAISYDSLGNSGNLNLGSSRSGAYATAFGGNSSAGDQIGKITFWGVNSNAWTIAARISANIVDSSFNSRLDFSVNSGSVPYFSIFNTNAVFNATALIPSVNFTPQIQINNNASSARTSLIFNQTSNDAISGEIHFLKNRSLAGSVAPFNNDVLGKLDFVAYNTASTPALVETAYFQVVADGSASAINVPSRFEWYTSTATSSAALAMQLNSSKNLSVTGTITGSNLSGTNTGDQTIALTGDVTGSGTGTFTTTIANNAVTLAKMANLSANSIIGNNTGSPTTPIALSSSQVLTMLNVAAGASVSSVGLSLPSIFSVSGSPVTGSGTLTATLANQNANLVFAGPTSGGAALPSFRAIGSADLGTGTATNGTVLLGNNTWSNSLSAAFNARSFGLNNSQNLGTVTTTAALNFTTSASWSFTLTAATGCTVSVTNPSSPCEVFIFIQQSSGTPSSITWPGNFLFGNGGAANFQPRQVASAGTWYVFWFDGTNYYMEDWLSNGASPSVPTALLSGIVVSANLGTGTASNGTFLRGDSTYSNSASQWLMGDVGLTSQNPAGFAAAAAAQVLSTGASGVATQLLGQYSNDNTSPAIQFFKSRGTSIGSYAANSSGDQLGSIRFYGVNTTPTPVFGSIIRTVVDGAPSSTNVPTRFEFGISTMSSTNAQVMSLNSGGCLTMGATTPYSFDTGRPLMQLQATSGRVLSTFTQWTNDAVAARLMFLKSRGTAVGTLTATSNADELGTIGFWGVNTTPAVSLSSFIQATQTGAGNATNIPSSLKFYTNNGTAASTLALTLDNTQNGTFGGTVTATNYIYTTFNIGTVASTCAVNWSTNGGNQKATTTNVTACTVSFTAPAGPCQLILSLIGPASGTSGLITWPTFKGAAPSTLGIGAGTTRMLWIWYDGANYWLTSSQTA